MERVLGRIRGPRPGPTLVGLAGLHGNERAGLRALRSVLDGLAPRTDEIAGEFVAMAGNLAALSVGRRFVDRDLNRVWSAERMDLLRRTGSIDGTAEEVEQREILETLQEVVSNARGPVYVLDLHTTSGGGGAFSTFGDTLPNRDFAEHIPVPMILGLEELIEGTLQGFLGVHGVVAVIFESGQHDEEAAVLRAEAATWISVASAGLLPERDLPVVTTARKLLRRETSRLPAALEMRYRHAITAADAFRMRPGFRNFQPVTRGQVVAADVRGEVRMPGSGRILMPLYQEQGEEGFFLIREFHPFWLRLSWAMRRVQADRIALRLPGVRPDPSSPDAVLVDKRVARWYAVQIFHLLGFRMHEDAGTHILLRRRRFDEARLVETGPLPEPLASD